jgi:hypothetical protein
MLHPDCYYVWASTAGWLPQYRWLRLLARAAYSYGGGCQRRSGPSSCACA